MFTTSLCCSKNNTQTTNLAYVLAGILDMQLLRGDVVEKFVVFALLDAAERVDTAWLKLNLKIERPGNY